MHSTRMRINACKKTCEGEQMLVSISLADRMIYGSKSEWRQDIGPRSGHCSIGPDFRLQYQRPTNFNIHNRCKKRFYLDRDRSSFTLDGFAWTGNILTLFPMSQCLVQTHPMNTKLDKRCVRVVWLRRLSFLVIESCGITLNQLSCV